MNQTRCLLTLTMCVLLTSAVRISTAATFTCETSGVACLIVAIHVANSTPEPDTIQLAAGTYLLTAVDNTTVGANGLPSVTSPITLQGVGAAQTVIVRVPSAPMFRLLHVAPTGALTVQGLTMTGGGASTSFAGGGIQNEGTLALMASRLANNGAGADGGGLANFGGQVTIERSEVVSNGAPHLGGGLYTSGGTVVITNSTFAGNSGGTFGGGLLNSGGTVVITHSTFRSNGAILGGGLANVPRTPTPSGTVVITNSTFAGNRANEGAGLFNNDAEMRLTNTTVVGNASGGFYDWALLNIGGSVELVNTIFAQNLGSVSPRPDCGDPLMSRGHNLFGDRMTCAIALQPTDLLGDPGLDAYADEGQPGHGHYPLLEDSPLIDAGDDRACLATDQLGNHRAGPCDIGAIEFQPPAAPPSLAIRLNQSTFQPGQTLRVTLDLSNPGPILTTDVYVGVILPDGVNTLFLTNVSPLEGVMTALSSDPRTFARLLRNVSWPAGMRATQQDYFTHTFTGLESSGTYHVLVGWTKPNSLEDGRIDEGDILALAWVPFTFTRGSTPALYATMRAIQAKHGK
jgi:uncharacterized repeat protein (TIGR01451 family)